MRQIEGAAERVTQLVVKADRRRAQHDAGQPRAIQRVGAGIEVGRVLHHAWQRTGQRANAFRRHQRHDRIAIDGVQPLHAVGHGIDPGWTRDSRRQRQREDRIVDDRARQHATVASRLLHAAIGDAVDRRHLRARIRRRHGDHRHPRLECDGFSRAGRGAAADGHIAVGVQCGGSCPGSVDDFDRVVHHRTGEDAGGERAESVCGILREEQLRLRRDDESAPGAEPRDLVAQTIEGTCAEHHAIRGLVEDEGWGHANWRLLIFDL